MFDPDTGRQILTHVIEEIRRTYRGGPGATVRGIAKLFKVSRYAANAILRGDRKAAEGRVIGIDLIQWRIDHAAEIERETGGRVRLEPEELKVRMPTDLTERIKPPKKKKHKPPPYISLIGASARAGAQRRKQARLEAMNKTPPKAAP